MLMMKLHLWTGWKSDVAGADPGFLERGFICIKVRGVRFADCIIVRGLALLILSHFS